MVGQLAEEPHLACSGGPQPGGADPGEDHILVDERRGEVLRPASELLHHGQREAEGQPGVLCAAKRVGFPVPTPMLA